MPTTYTPLATTTLSSAQSSVTFSSISGAYTDLVLVMDVFAATGGTTDYTTTLRFNSDTGSNYSDTILRGNGTSATSGRHSNISYIQLQGNGYLSTTVPCTHIVNIMNYANTTTHKTVLSRASQADNVTNATVGLWRSTAAITSLTILLEAGTMKTGSTFSLYGVASAAVVSGAKATGGDVVATDGTYWYHAFRSSGTFTPSQALTCDYLVVAGGGSTSADFTAGAGAGGYRSATGQSFSSGVAYTMTVGAGAAVQSYTNGSNSSISGSGFTTFTASGGGRSGSTGSAGVTGGSGGGAPIGSAQSGAAGNSGGYTPVEGYKGGDSTGSGVPRSTGGGGGAGGAGGNGNNSGNGGVGGVGSNAHSSWLSVVGLGVSGYLAGGGGGTGESAGSAGGAGGGGNGGNAGSGALGKGTDGTVNTGGGAGGAGNGGGNGSSGGSGLVIVRYAV